VADGGPMLIGVKGVVSGERFPLLANQEVLVGRSRSCEICLGKCRRWLQLNTAQQEADDEFNSVSRKHLRVIFRPPDTVELEDLSANGTFLDGQRLQRTRITDLKQRAREVRLGTRESFRLEWRGE